MPEAKTKAEKQPRRFPGQHEDEEVLLVFHQHPLVMRKQLIIGLTVILLSVLPLLRVEWVLNTTLQKVPFVAAGIVFVYWFYRWVGWYYSVYIFTNERVVEIKQRGFFNRKVTEFGLDKVQNVNYHIKGFQAVIFQFGEITIQTYVGDLVMQMIYKPVQIHNQILKIVRKVQSTMPPDL